MAVRLPFRLKLILASLVLVLGIFLARPWWLSWLGYALVHDDGPAQADIAVVLAGDAWGDRIEKGGDLVRAGYVPAALVSGPAGLYGFRESELAIHWAEQRGYAVQSFIPLPNDSHSTKSEAQMVLAELRGRKVHSFLLVTSNFHTARARRIYLAAQRAMGLHLQMRTVAAPDHTFRPDSWWRDREARKTVFMEWCKTIAEILDL